MSRKRQLFTREFWADTSERAIFTCAEAVGGVFTLDVIRNAVTSDDFSSLYWTGAGVALTTALAVVKAIAVAAKNDVDSASAIPASLSLSNGI